jgi:hypothetical protein
MKKASRQKNSDFVQRRLGNPFVKGEAIINNSQHI